MSATMESTSALFRAFADPTRIRLLNLMLEGEVCVCDLVAVLDQPQPTVSRHLAALRRAKLVRVRSDGRWKYYRAARGAAGIERTLLNCVRRCLREIDVLQSDLARLKEVRGTGCC
ncbi:MAG: winged helix-turn-helix transcriptional regulator [Phycisphaerae bacterium]|nr:winged helix-turn-helix transcriptional regulator [Phycisphaerae bacterium]